MKVAIVLNTAAGKLARAKCEERAAEILAACRRRGLDATAHLCEPARLTALARRLAASGDVDAIVACGGDGTVSAIAGGLVGRDVALAVVPLGTLNHFAKDLGIRDVETALDTLVAGRRIHVDVGEVNGKVFINNSSIGLYPEIVVNRDRERHEAGRSKWRAMLHAALQVLSRFPVLHVAIAVAGEVVSARTPFVFVGNNEYATTVRALGSRRRLDAGRLHVAALRATTRLKMIWSLLRTIVQRGEPPELEAHRVERADIVTAKRSVKVAIDGEVVRMTPPLTYRIRPGALTVLAPPAQTTQAGNAA